MAVGMRFLSLVLMSAAIIAALNTIAVACMAPRVYFQFQSSEVSASWSGGLKLAQHYIEKSAPDCRYVLIARADVAEERDDPTLSIARRRAEEVVNAFQALGVSRDRFDIVVKIGEASRQHEVLRDMDRIVSIHSARQGGQVVSCGGVPTCTMCVRKLPTGGECHEIPGAEY